MRRSLLDPDRPASERLAAATVLAFPPGPWWEPAAFAGVPAPGPDQPIMERSPTLSPSQAESYSACPRRYALERRLRLGDAGSPYASFGTLVHSALERAEREVVGTGRPHADLEDALSHLDQVWLEEADFGTPELDAAWLRHAVAAVTKLYEKWPSPDSIPIGLEMGVGAEIEGTRWYGIVDRLERGPDGLRVVDYKTGKTYPTGAEAAVSIQLAFYALAVARETGEEVVAAEMWFPRTDAKSVTTRHLDVSGLADVEAEMARVASAIYAEQWEPKVGDACRRCGFRRSCPAWPEGQGAYLP
jgi:putative RecB family exonuclease